MLIQRKIALVFSILLSLSCIAQAETISLFNGKDLTGWNTVSHDNQFWSVKDGSITADSFGNKMPRNTYLFTDKEYDNFEFRCKFRLTGQPKTGLVNSGIQFRTAKHGNGSAKGYQADIGEPKWWGCLYDEHRRGLIARSDMSKLKGTLKPFGWNDYLIRADGPTITLFINGIQTIQYIEKDPKIPAKGHFALQLHSGGICQIQYKDITLKPLATKTVKKEKKVISQQLDGKSVIFEDFEKGNYDNWTVTGTAFGTKPIHIDRAPSYQNLQPGGKYCVNSHASAAGGIAEKDKATGTLTSKPFTIQKKYIHLFVCGGNHPKKTCVNLIIDGKVVSSLTGKNSNQFSLESFQTETYKGKQAQIQIVDQVSGGWGNIGVDQIVFSDSISAKKPKTVVKTPAKNIPQRLSQRKGALTPEEERLGFSVPEGFVVELVASEEHGVINPFHLSFDDAGRLWSNTGKMYPLDTVLKPNWRELIDPVKSQKFKQNNPKYQKTLDLYKGKIQGDDAILIIDDPTGQPKNARVWADGLAIPNSILPYQNGAFVAHGSDMIFLEDTNGDNKADRRTTILSGYGIVDTHCMSHCLVRGPGGWINYSHGALNNGLITNHQTNDKIRVDFSKIARFSIDGMKHELVNAGLNNIWGYQLRANGKWYGVEANDMGYSTTPMEARTSYPGIGNRRLRNYQTHFPAPNRFRVGGTGISGLAFSEDGTAGFPEEWRNVAFLANPITSTINAVSTKRNPNGTVTSKHLKNFLTSKDRWFRPVHALFGPDGNLYIADFYNRVISHNEVARNHPDRDKLHGRIWRIRYTGNEVKKITNMIELEDSKLVEQLKEPMLWNKRAAWHQIVDRHAKKLAPELKELCLDTNNDSITRIHALWSLEGLKHYDYQFMQSLLKDQDGDLRKEAVRALASLPVLENDMFKLLSIVKEDKNVMVRSQLLRTLEDYGKSSQELIDMVVSFCKPDIHGGHLGGPYERKFERYLARRTLEAYPFELHKYLNSDLAKNQNKAHIDWAKLAQSQKHQAIAFLGTWQNQKDKAVSAEVFKKMCKVLDSNEVVHAVKPVFEGKHSSVLVKHSLDFKSEILSPELRNLLIQSCTKLLTSTDKADIELGIRATKELVISNQESHIAYLINKKLLPNNLLSDAVNIISRKPHGYEDLFVKVLELDELETNTMIASLIALAQIKPVHLKSVAKKYVPELTAVDQISIVNQLVANTSGAKIVLDLLSDKVLPESIIDMALAEKLYLKSNKDHRATAVLDKQKALIVAEQKAFKHKLEKFISIGMKKSGNPLEGKPLFNAMCLSCHAVKDEGIGFAPPLDGSAHRDLEHLLTSILNPDAAIESNYMLYRVNKLDGSIVEGYLEKQDKKGATLRFMGGGKVFVPKAEIAKGEFVKGRSVMPKGLIDGLPEPQVANLLAYIRTLK